MMFSKIRQDYAAHDRKLSNPAFMVMCTYRFGQWALARRSRIARGLAGRIYGVVHYFIGHWTKIWIPPQVRIGEEFHIIHAEGSISIHPDTVIGDRFGVMHNVTIGTNMTPGAPVIGDDVFVGVNSVILGKVRIGDRVKIAACTAVTTDVPSDSIVVGSPAKIYPRLGPFRR